MLYEYACSRCNKVFTVVKNVKDYSREEFCEDCNSPLTKIFSKVTVSIDKTSYSGWNPGLGENIKNKNHHYETMRRKNLIEVGNESIEKIDSSFEKERMLKIQKGWDNLKVEGI